MVNGIPTQGDIIKINLDPKQGHEQAGYRPYICLSHQLVSDYANVAVFAPISNTARRYPLYVPLSKTRSTGVAMLDQLVTIDYRARQFQFVETVPDDFLQKLLSTVILVFQPNRRTSPQR
ncbi:MAG: type II toxin-antitoxin system PemK/MazF family toxin [Planctomycetota bacterium]|jgi:mRNA interferase MazF|nr:type II toxin-antitoxin system PemK/MazF family toxin [Planctomycetota bacterium]